MASMWGASKTNTAIDANRGPAPKSQKVDPFADHYDSFNGRISLANKISASNKYVQSTHTGLDTWEGAGTKALRNVRETKPAFLPTPYATKHAEKKLSGLKKNLEEIKPQVDSSAPRAWEHKKLLTQARKRSLSSRRNHESGSFQVNWSAQMQQNGSNYLEMHKKATKRPGQSELDNQMPEPLARFKTFWDKQRSLGKTAASNKISAPIPGQELFEAPGGPADTVTGSAGGKLNRLSLAQQRCREAAAGRRPKPVQIKKKKGLRAQLQAQLVAQCTETAFNAASNPQVQANYLRDHWQPPSPVVDPSEIEPLGATPRSCIAKTAYAAKSDRELTMAKGDQVFAIKSDTGGTDLMVFNEAGEAGSVPAAVLSFSDQPTILTGQSLIDAYTTSRAPPAPASPTQHQQAKIAACAASSRARQQPRPARVRPTTSAATRPTTMNQLGRNSAMLNNSRSPWADKMFGKSANNTRPATASGFLRSGSKYSAHQSLNTDAVAKVKKKPLTPRDTWLDFTNSVS